MTELPPLKQVVEAALLASSTPLSLPQLFTLFGENEQPSHEDLARVLEELARDCEGRGVELKEVASGFRYQIRTETTPWVSRLWTERQTRYSRAQLETLALIAYRQPITRGEIENIRGVAVSSNIIKTLEEREWIRTVGHRDVPGKPELFGTTRAFLDYFNLKSLDELPPLAEIRDLSDFDPQLGLAPVTLDEAAADNVDGSENAATGEAEGATSEQPQPTRETAEATASAAEASPQHETIETGAAAETSGTPNQAIGPGTAADAPNSQHEAAEPERFEPAESHEITQDPGPADEGDTSSTPAAGETAPVSSEQNP